jgi:hypothetical protein
MFQVREPSHHAQGPRVGVTCNMYNPTLSTLYI